MESFNQCVTELLTRVRPGEGKVWDTSSMPNCAPGSRKLPLAGSGQAKRLVLYSDNWGADKSPREADPIKWEQNGQGVGARKASLGRWVLSGVEKDTLLRYSCLGNSMGRGAGWNREDVGVFDGI